MKFSKVRIFQFTVIFLLTCVIFYLRIPSNKREKYAGSTHHIKTFLNKLNPSSVKLVKYELSSETLISSSNHLQASNVISALTSIRSTTTAAATPASTTYTPATTSHTTSIQTTTTPKTTTTPRTTTTPKTTTRRFKTFKTTKISSNNSNGSKNEKVHITTSATSNLWSQYEDIESLSRTPDISLPVNCDKLFENDANEIANALEYKSSHETDKAKALNEEIRLSKQMLRKTHSCKEYLGAKKYIVGPTSHEEQAFPIAYSILVFRDILQIEKLLRAIYRSQNFYCVHLDSKASPEFRKAIESITSCFDNVFMSSQSVNVTWATYSVLEPELICMGDLLKRSSKFTFKSILYDQCTIWKYFINLTGQEWPLKTNKELVSILKAYKGGNDVEGSIKRSDPARYKNLFEGMYLKGDNVPNPVKVTMVKGSVHIVVQRGFVEFVINDEIAKKFANWLNGTWAPDETFFASLNHSPQLNIPGSYLGEPETDPVLKPFLARFKNWGSWPFDYPCQGKWVKQICVFGVGDLWFLKQRKELFANKFYIDFEPMTLNCMEQWHYKRIKNDLDGTSKFDTSYYESLSFSKYHSN